MNELEKSIEHWKENLELVRDSELPDIYSDSCALCSKYRPSCVGCPVAVRTGKPYCGGTPYYDVTEIMDWENIDWDTLEAAVNDEIEFLESLR